LWAGLAAGLAGVKPTARARILLRLVTELNFRRDFSESMWLLRQTTSLPGCMQPRILCHLALFDLDWWHRRQISSGPFLEQWITAIAALPARYQGLPLQPLREMRRWPSPHPALAALWQRFDAICWSAPDEDIRFD
jgi:hypothetical protein